MDYTKPINYLNAYLYFMWNYATLETFKDIFNDSEYDYYYIFNDVWCNKCNQNPSIFWANIDLTVRDLIFNYAVDFFKNKII